VAAAVTDKITWRQRNNSKRGTCFSGFGFMDWVDGTKTNLRYFFESTILMNSCYAHNIVVQSSFF
jgi:hypothetical protein